jgi:hypothetical protein
MAYGKLPLASCNQAIGIRQLKQAADNIDNILSALATNHGTADGAFQVGQSNVGRHDGLGTTEASSMSQRLTIAVSQRFDGSGERFISSPPHPSVAPFRPQDFLPGGGVVVRVKDLEACAARVTAAQGSSGAEIATVSVAKADDDDFPWRIVVKLFAISGAVFIETSIHSFTLQVWGK